MPILCVIKLIWLMHTWLPEGIKFSKLLRGSLILFWVDEEIFRDGLKCVTERTRGDNISCTKAAPRWPKLRYLTCDISGKVNISFIVKNEVGFTKARIIFGSIGVLRLDDNNFPKKPRATTSWLFGRVIVFGIIDTISEIEKIADGASAEARNYHG